MYGDYTGPAPTKLPGLPPVDGIFHTGGLAGEGRGIGRPPYALRTRHRAMDAFFGGCASVNRGIACRNFDNFKPAVSTQLEHVSLGLSIAQLWSTGKAGGAAGDKIELAGDGAGDAGEFFYGIVGGV